MSPRVFYYVIVELCGGSVVFWHCAFSLGVHGRQEVAISLVSAFTLHFY